MKICESFSSSESCNTVYPPSDPPKLTVFTQITQDEIGKIISKSPTKSCLLDPLPTFLIKECIDILLPSITSKVNLHRLQSIQNSARIVTNSCKYTPITPVLRKLHWLPIQFRSEFKLATLVYKFIHTGFHKYFAPHLSTYRTTYNTRRSQSVANFLNVPKFQPTIRKSTKQFGFSFAFDAPTVWNSLPEDIRASPTIASFRKKLKTYLYAKAYPLSLIFPYGFSVVPTCFCPWTLNFAYCCLVAP